MAQVSKSVARLTQYCELCLQTGLSRRGEQPYRFILRCTAVDLDSHDHKRQEVQRESARFISQVNVFGLVPLEG